MGRIILGIIGVVLAIWFAFMALGWLFSIVKFFLVIGVIAVIVYLAVSMVAKSNRKL